jgi:hypothetical protein
MELAGAGLSHPSRLRGTFNCTTDASNQICTELISPLPERIDG